MKQLSWKRRRRDLFSHFLSLFRSHPRTHTPCVCQENEKNIYSITVERSWKELFTRLTFYHDDYGWLRGREGRKEELFSPLHFSSPREKSCCSSDFTTGSMRLLWSLLWGWGRGEIVKKKNFCRSRRRRLCRIVMSESITSSDKQKNIYFIISCTQQKTANEGERDCSRVAFKTKREKKTVIKMHFLIVRERKVHPNDCIKVSFLFINKLSESWEQFAWRRLRWWCCCGWWGSSRIIQILMPLLSPLVTLQWRNIPKYSSIRFPYPLSTAMANFYVQLSSSAQQSRI